MPKNKTLNLNYKIVNGNFIFPGGVSYSMADSSRLCKLSAPDMKKLHCVMKIFKGELLPVPPQKPTGSFYSSLRCCGEADFVIRGTVIHCRLCNRVTARTDTGTAAELVRMYPGYQFEKQITTIQERFL